MATNVNLSKRLCNRCDARCSGCAYGFCGYCCSLSCGPNDPTIYNDPDLAYAYDQALRADNAHPDQHLDEED